MTPNEQKAADIIQREAIPAAWNVPSALARAATALSAAGLLVTPDHEAALAACERMALDYPRFHLTGDESNDSALGAAVRVGRRSLYAKKPKERWALVAADSLEARKDGVTMWCFPHDAEPEAKAYVERMNAKEAAR